MTARGGLSKFGKFLSGMVMPNIGALIAWGFLTALFISTGWFPNENFAKIVSPMLTYLIPILIAGQGGYMVGGKRGRVIASVAVVGCIVGSEYTMLMGAMLMGPFAGWVIKKWDEWAQPRTKAGFEMLVDNFSVGILGLLLSLLGYVVVGPFMGAILAVLTAGVQVLTDAKLIPLLAIFIEPAKVLFLNNAINHGIFTPIGATQVAEAGRSIMYMLEADPGPGLGVLLAYCLFSRDPKAKQSAPGAVIIHFFGGIHEIYFPYVLMNPKVIIAPIVGNVCAITWFMFTGCGLVAPASPGSIIAFLAMCPREYLLQTIIGVAIATGVSFIIAMPIVRAAEPSESLDDGKDKMANLKSGETVKNSFGDKIVFACDAGMGSSAMAATRFRNRIKADRPDVIVDHSSVDDVPGDANIVVCQNAFADRARKAAPNAQLVTIENFLDDPGLDNLFRSLVEATAPEAAAIAAPAASAEEPATKGIAIERDGIKLGCKPVSREKAIRAVGKMLVDKGCVEESYVDAMVERDKSQSVYMGMGVAIPHGTNEAKGSVKKTGVVFMQYPEGVQWGDEKATLVFGIAGIGDEHLGVLAKVCEVLGDDVVLEKLKTTDDIDWILKTLS